MELTFPSLRNLSLSIEQIKHFASWSFLISSCVPQEKEKEVIFLYVPNFSVNQANIHI